jgi:hypothetical protein
MYAMFSKGIRIASWSAFIHIFSVSPLAFGGSNRVTKKHVTEQEQL